MRIGMIVPPWLPVPPTAYGGIESVVGSLTVALAEAGHEVILAASADSTCPVELLPGAGPSDADTIGMSLQELAHIVRSYAILPEVDVIHDHTLSGPLYWNRPPGIPLVSTVHAPFTRDVLDIYRHMPADCTVVAISAHQASTGDGVNVDRVIHHGLDPSSIPVGNGQGGFACFLGRMHPNKGVREAILIAREAGVPLRLAAKMREPLEYHYFDSAIRPLLGGDIEFLGELTGAEKYELVGDAVALLNPIQWAEPFGMVLIEALATGTPVIATPRGSAPEIIDDGRTGYLRNDNAALARVLQVAGELDRATCRTAVEERFSATKMAADYARLYADVLTASVTPARLA
jgi:glycosyltransferase involved in cell wall biosynthesis